MERLNAEDLHLVVNLPEGILHSLLVSQVLGEDLRRAEGESDILLQRPEDVPHPSRRYVQGRDPGWSDQLHSRGCHRLHKEEICLQAEVMFLSSLSLSHSHPCSDSQTVASTCSKLRTRSRWICGWTGSTRRRSLTRRDPRARPCHLGRRRRTNQREDRSSLSRKSKNLLDADTVSSIFGRWWTPLSSSSCDWLGVSSNNNLVLPYHTWPHTPFLLSSVWRITFCFWRITIDLIFPQCFPVCPSEARCVSVKKGWKGSKALLVLKSWIFTFSSCYFIYNKRRLRAFVTVQCTDRSADCSCWSILNYPSK